MKKVSVRIISVMLCALVLLGLAAGCTAVENNDPYMSLVTSNWKNTYAVGDKISLDGLTLRYCPDCTKLEEYEDIAVTADMVSGFDTSKAGKFTLTLTYKGLTETVEYSVFEKTAINVKGDFCIATGIVASIDSASGKITLTTYADYLSYKNGNGTKAEVTASTEISGEGKTYLKFEYNDTVYKISETDGSYFITATSKSGTATSSQTVALEPCAPYIPAAGASYVSSPSEDGKKATCVFGEDGSVSVYLTDKDASDVSGITPEITISLENAKIVSPGRISFTTEDGGFTYTVTVADANSLSVRKGGSDGSMIYRYTCNSGT